MTNDWKKNFVYYSVLAMLALSTVVVTVLKLNVKYADAQGGCNVVVTEDGATCDNSGSNPGGGGTDGGNGNDTGTPGDSGGGNNNNDNGNGDEGSCIPGTPGEFSLNVPPGSLNLPNDSIIYTLPDGSTVTGSTAPAGMCTTVSQWVDTCTGEAMGDPSGPIPNGSGVFALSECPTHYDTPPTPCDEFTVNSGGVTCTTDFVTGDLFPGSEWQLTVHTPWPGAEIHTRPYPVTL